VADIRDGKIVLSETPGLGVEPDVTAIEKYRTL
jgi:L-alanine-DL-glutamate epimerase-like enolase superfamily enzyme